MLGIQFSEYTGNPESTFDRLFKIFKEILTHTSGDVDEALDWLGEIDREYKITNEDYTMDDFIEELKKRGYLKEELDPEEGSGGLKLTAKAEQAIRQSALDQIFGKLKKSGKGNHKTKHSGSGDETNGDFKPFEFGDKLERISLTESLKNAQINHGVGNFSDLSEDDLVVEDQDYKAQMSTVLMIDISHSMILYGEDRITPAKKGGNGA